METRPGQELRVGILLIVAVGLIVGAYYITGHLWGKPRATLYVHFDNAGGLKAGDSVQMAGVTIGKVLRVGLDVPSGALASLHIYPTVAGRRVRLYDNYEFRVRTGGLIPETGIEVVEREPRGALLRAGAKVVGKPPVRLEDVVESAKEAVENIAAITTELHAIVAGGEVRQAITESARNLTRATAETARFAARLGELARASGGHVLETARNIEQASLSVRRAAEQVNRLVSDPALEQEVHGTLASLERAAQNLATLTGDPALKASIANLSQASERLAASAQAVEKVVARPQTAKDFEETLAAIRRAAENIESASARLNELASDSGLGEDVRSSVRHVAEATEKASQALNKVNRLLEAGERLATSTSKVDAQVLQDIYYSEQTRGWQGALNLEITAGQTGRSVIVGAEDIGQGNRANVKVSGQLNDRYRLRGGLHRGQMGVGVTTQALPRLDLALDLYKPRDLAADFWAKYRITGGLSLAVGEEGIFRGNYPRVGVTLRY